MVPGCKVLVARALFLGGSVLLHAAMGRSAMAQTDVTLDIKGDTTWTVAGSPYRVLNDIDVLQNATLIIEPGVEVQLNTGVSITVGGTVDSGALWAVGTASQPITFEQNPAQTQPGRWGSIRFVDTTVDAESRLEHCTLDYGGATGKSGAIHCQSASPSFADVTIHQSKVSAIYLESSSPSFFGAVQQTGGATTGGGGLLGGASSTSFGGPGGPGQFGATEWLIYATSTSSVPTFVSPDLFSQGKFLHMGPRAWANLFNASPAIQGSNYIGEVLDGTLTVSSTWGDPAIAAFRLLGNLTIAGDSQSWTWPTLTITAGSVFRLEAGKAIEVGATFGTFQGGLIVAGTAAKPVVIEGQSGAAWRHLRYGSYALPGHCRLEHTVLRGGGAASVPPLFVAASLLIEGGTPTLTDVRVEESVASGVYVANTAPTVANLTVDGFGATGTGLYCRNFTEPGSVSVQMTGTNLIDGRGVGQAGVRLNGSEPHLEGLSIAGITGMAIDGAVGGAVAPTFANVTVAANAGALGQGSPDLWANFFNSNPTLLGSGWVQEVTTGQLRLTTTWGGHAAISSIHLQNDLSIGGTESPMLTLVAGTLVTLDSPRSILVGSPDPGGLRILGTEADPVILEPSGAGRWGRIRFVAVSRPDSSIEHCELRSCGGTNDAAALEVSGVSLPLRDIVMTDCWRGAILLSNSSSALSNIRIDDFDVLNGPVTLYPAISISNGDDVTLTGSNVIRGGPGTGRRAFSISPSLDPLKNPILSGIDIDEISEYAFYTTAGTGTHPPAAPTFTDVVVGPNVGDLAIGGPGFWAKLLNSNAAIQGTGYVQKVYGGTLQKTTTWGSGPGQTFSEIHLQGGLTIDGADPVLTLTPGTTVRIAAGASITVDSNVIAGTGALVAVGTPAQHIVFDSITPGQQWRTILLQYQSAEVGSRLEYCDFYNGGSGTPATVSAWQVSGELPTLRDLTFTQASGTAIRIAAGTGNGWIDSVNVYGCDMGVEVDQSAGSLVITNSTFDSLGTAGIKVLGPSSLNLVESCTFTNTKQALWNPTGLTALVFHQCSVSNWGQGGVDAAAVEFSAGSYPAILGSSFTGNGVVAKIPASAADNLCHPLLPNSFTLGASSRIDLWGDTLESPTCWTDAIGVPFRVLGNVSYTAPLTIEAGVEVQFAQSNTVISMPLGPPEQPLRVLGTSEKPVILSPVGTSWGGLVGGPGTMIEHAVIDRAGLASTQALELRGPGTVRDTTISNSLGYGLLQTPNLDVGVMASPTWLIGCTFSDNTAAGVRLPGLALIEAEGCTFDGNLGAGAISSAGSSVSSAKASLRECTFTGNVPGAITFVSGTTSDLADARFCWWDHADGPAGGAQTISHPDRAKFDPWYATPLGAFRITGADVDPTTFDPLGGEVRWSGELTAVGTWTLEVEDSASASVHSDSGSGAIDAVWDGTDNGASQAPDGDYTFVLTADETGGAMAQSVLKGTVTLESSALIAEIHSPDELTFVAGGSSLSITGTAAGSQLATYVLEYGFGNNPKTFTQVATGGGTPIVAGTLGTLQVVPDAVEQGILTVRLRVLDASQNAVTAVRPYKLHSIVTSAATPDPFSPNADGFQDQCTLNASMAWASEWTVGLFQGTTGPIRTWPPGTGTQILVAWDGKDANGALQPEGIYTFKIDATAPDASTVATASVPVEIDTDGKAIEIVAPTGAEPLHGVVAVDVDIGAPPGVDYHWRLERGPLPTWSLIASGTQSASPDVDWNTTLAPSGPTTLRASLILADGTVHEDEVAVTIANPDVTLTTRAFDPLNGESTMIGLNHGGVSLDGNVVFNVRSATVTTDFHWIGKVASIGPVVWTSPQPQPLTDGEASVLWDGTVSPGVPAPAGDYVVEALVSYAGGSSATYAEDPGVSYPVDNTLLVNTSVGSGFDPFYAERVPIAYGLLEPAWVTLSYNSGLIISNPPILEVHGMMKNVLHDGGPTHLGHVFEWDGRAVDRDGLAAGDGDGEPVEFYGINVRLVRVPRSLMTLTNRRTLIEDPKVSPVVIQPVHGQIATLTCTLPYDALVSVRLVDTVDSGLANSAGTHFRTLMTDELQLAGSFVLEIDGTDDAGGISARSGTFTVVIEAKDAAHTSFTATRRLCLRILE